MHRPFAWLCLVITILLGVVYILNLPFYAGSSVGRFGWWRMEHGRLTIDRSAVGSTESFYIALNSEGLRFLPDWLFWSVSEWRVTIPLWMPMVFSATGTVYAFRRRKRGRAGVCPGCGYSRKGLDADSRCPECGRAVVPEC